MNAEEAFIGKIVCNSLEPNNPDARELLLEALAKNPKVSDALADFFSRVGGDWIHDAVSQALAVDCSDSRRVLLAVVRHAPFVHPLHQLHMLQMQTNGSLEGKLAAEILGALLTRPYLCPQAVGVALQHESMTKALAGNVALYSGRGLPEALRPVALGMGITPEDFDAMAATPAFPRWVIRRVIERCGFDQFLDARRDLDIDPEDLRLILRVCIRKDRPLEVARVARRPDLSREDYAEIIEYAVYSQTAAGRPPIPSVVNALAANVRAYALHGDLVAVLLSSPVEEHHLAARRIVEGLHAKAIAEGDEEEELLPF